MNGGEWGFTHCTNNGFIEPPSNLRLSAKDVRERINNALKRQKQLVESATQSHRNYWIDKGGHNEHFWRYDYGWQCGWADALAFFSMRQIAQRTGTGGDKIGFLGIWMEQRVRECNQGGPHKWQFRHGFQRGVQDFYSSAGI